MPTQVLAAPKDDASICLKNKVSIERFISQFKDGNLGSLKSLKGKCDKLLNIVKKCEKPRSCVVEKPKAPAAEKPAPTPVKPKAPAAEKPAPTPEKPKAPAAEKPAPAPEKPAPAPEKPNTQAPQKPESPAKETTVPGNYEAKVVDLVNKERAAQGLAPLKYNAELSKVARIKAEDMRDKNYFSHTSPTYGSPFDMMKSFGIKYRAAGENIAKGYRTPESVMDGWMNSPGHKANIMSPNFTEVGVGYVTDSKGTGYWVQMFIRP
ncbi:MAG: serine protease [Clostridiales bacterium]|nr:serine protease [Clostridiales bacterium]